MSGNPRSTYRYVCDHCEARSGKVLRTPPLYWRRAEVVPGEFVTECPDCAVAWDLEQERRVREGICSVRRAALARSGAVVFGQPVEA